MKLRDYLLIGRSQLELDSEITLTPPVVAPTPIDCVLSDWSAWGPHPTDLALERRTRTVVTAPAHGGAPCGPMEETRAKPVVTPSFLTAPPGIDTSNNQAAGTPDTIDISRLPPHIPYRVWHDATGRHAQSMGGRKPKWYRKHSTYGTQSGLYATTPAILDLGGAKQIAQVIPRLGTDPVLNIRKGLDDWGAYFPGKPRIPYPVRPGVRGVNIHTPYMTVHGHTRILDDGSISTNPHTPMWLGLTMHGEIHSFLRDGSVELLGKVPIAPKSYTFDYTFFDPNRKLFFYVETPLGVLRKVDRATTPWTVTDFANGLGRATSCRAIENMIYVADNTSGNVYKIDAATGAKRVLCNVPKCFWIDYDSRGRLLVMTDRSELYRVDADTGAIGPNMLPGVAGNSLYWVQCAVDRHGHFGLQDQTYAVRPEGGGNIDFWCVPETGAFTRGISGGNGSFVVGNTMWCPDPTGHYPWTVAVHPDEGCLAVSGFGNQQLAVIEAVGDVDPFPRQMDWQPSFGQGKLLITKLGGGPSLNCQMNADCWSYLGVTADYIASLGSAGAYDYLCRGMSGSFPRTISKADATPMLSYIFGNSQDHLLRGRAVIDDLVNYLGRP